MGLPEAGAEERGGRKTMNKGRPTAQEEEQRAERLYSDSVTGEERGDV